MSHPPDERMRELHDAIADRMRERCQTYLRELDEEDVARAIRDAPHVSDGPPGDCDDLIEHDDYESSPFPRFDIQNLLTLLPSFQTDEDATSTVKQLRELADAIEQRNIRWESHVDRRNRWRRERGEAPTP